MECKRCGGTMMPETVIKLRRSVFVGFRETRSRGAYCATCQVGVSLETHQVSANEPVRARVRARRDARCLPAWSASRPQGGHAGVIAILWRNRLNRLTAWMPS